MADAYEDRLRQGRELREMRRRHAHPESPCARCNRDFCPQLCFTRMDWNKRRRGRDDGQCPPVQAGGADG